MSAHSWDEIGEESLVMGVPSYPAATRLGVLRFVKRL
jgi:hypothetical protein